MEIRVLGYCGDFFDNWKDGYDNVYHLRDGNLFCFDICYSFTHGRSTYDSVMYRVERHRDYIELPFYKFPDIFTETNIFRHEYETI